MAAKYCITSDGKRIPLDGEITFGYDEDGVCHVSWNTLPKRKRRRFQNTTRTHQ